MGTDLYPLCDVLGTGARAGMEARFDIGNGSFTSSPKSLLSRPLWAGEGLGRRTRTVTSRLSDGSRGRDGDVSRSVGVDAFGSTSSSLVVSDESDFVDVFSEPNVVDMLFDELRRSEIFFDMLTELGSAFFKLSSGAFGAGKHRAQELKQVRTRTTHCAVSKSAMTATTLRLSQSTARASAWLRAPVNRWSTAGGSRGWIARSMCTAHAS